VVRPSYLHLFTVWVKSLLLTRLPVPQPARQMLTTAQHEPDEIETDETNSATTTFTRKILRKFFSRGANAVLSVALAGKDETDERAVLPAVLSHGYCKQQPNNNTQHTTHTLHCKQQQTQHNTCRFSVGLLITPKNSEVCQ